MIQTIRKKAGMTFTRKWFARSWSYRDAFGFTSLRQYLGDAVPPSLLFSCDRRFTLLIDLSLDTESILKAMHKNMRYQLRRAEKDDFSWREIKDTKAFQEFYNNFAQEKGLPFLRDNVLAAEKTHLNIYEVVLHDDVVVAHAYLIDPEEKRARFLYGASVRLNEKFDQNLIGRANRLGHWKEIQHFKEMGLQVFDFGGYAKDTNDPEKKGIGNFKSAFGGVVVQENSYNTRLYELYRKIVK